ncbi:hypothetical protein [Mycobacterium leprae]|nr:hypothetical protein [Mycobacterium leprae]
MLFGEFDAAYVQKANTTSGAPLTVSSVPDMDAENDLPERNGR